MLSIEIMCQTNTKRSRTANKWQNTDDTGSMAPMQRKDNNGATQQ